ncbi:asparaginase [Periweissella cryptocerci]|uniref:asparaginase n=1 Tax=Periweissella cryptocerci TaxID=2506420 RepID=A0A4P6YXE7_9LACO|nr:asparaginase [Periweissella cryptocerci]QBO37521.1 asparaginase [Periweissella cryptocerci]
MKKILVLHTGGTIAMHEEANGDVAQGAENPLMSAALSTAEDVELIVEDIFNLPSPHVTPEHMLQLKDRIQMAIRNEGIFGVVITHGTDTLEETAYFLDSTIASATPIVVTGAMRSSNELGSDGLYNYLSAIRVAGDEQSRGKGVLVVMNDEIHPARYVTKTHTTNVATFQSPSNGPIGLITKKQIVFYHQLTPYAIYDIDSVQGSVPIVKAYAGMSGDIFGLLFGHGIDGLIIEALGAGNLPPKAAAGIQTLLDAKIPVVLVSRSFNGVAEPVYSYEGGGAQLEEKGVMFGNSMNSQKARLKLLIGLNAHLDAQQLRSYMHDN